jgi:hypothetical protein
MAQSVAISPNELTRVGALAYGGKTIKVMLCNVGVTGYDSSSTVANWQSVELSGAGYVRYSQAIPAGSYNIGAAAFVIPDIDASFTSTSGSSFDRIIIYIDGETYVHSVISESPNISIAAGQTITYRLSLRSDD